MWVELSGNQWVRGDTIIGVRIISLPSEGKTVPWATLQTIAVDSIMVVKNPNPEQITTFLSAISSTSHFVVGFEELQRILS